jgi:probable HAF family extracellular repeat protein
MRARGFAIKMLTCAAALWNVAVGSGAKAQTVDHTGGFANRIELMANGDVTFPNGRLRLTDAATGGVSSVFTAYHVNVARFQTSFTFQITSPGADGLAFVLQRAGSHATGGGGGGLGYHQMPNSVAVKFDFFPNDNDPWWSSTGVFRNGELPFGGDAVEPSGIDFRNGHVFRADIAYGKQRLTLTITDTATNAHFTREYAIDIPATIGADTAFVGFTSATGGFTATQEVLTWEYRSPSPVLPYYTLTNLNSPYGGAYAYARAINNAGQVIGFFQNYPPPFRQYQDHTFLYANGTLTNIVPSWMEYTNVYGYAINDSGTITGVDSFDSISGNGVTYLNGSRAALPQYGGDFTSVAYGINDHAESVGVATDTGLYWWLREIQYGRAYATMWADGTAFRLPAVANTEYSAAYDINNRASATGWFKRFNSSERRGIAWVSPGLSPQELPLTQPGEGWAINDYNEIAGILYEPSGALHAFKLDENWTQRNLHSSSYKHSLALGLNNLGEVVGGWSTVYTPNHLFQYPTERAVYFTNSGGIDLNTRIPANSGVTLVEAAGINDKGQIAASGWIAGNKLRPFLLTPTNPVPTIGSLSPNSAVAGAGPIQMTVNGSGFSPTSVLLWNGNARETLFISESQLLVPISNTDVFNIGTATVQVYTAAPGGGVSNTVNFPILGRKVQGAIGLEDCTAPGQPVSFWFQADTGESFQRTLTLNTDGTFTLDVPARQYTVWVKGAKWLRKAASVNTIPANASVSVSLRGGDANNDNSVDVLDLDLLVQAFDSGINDGNWNEGADLNCDLSVDVLDLDLLIRNFDQVGD